MNIDPKLIKSLVFTAADGVAYVYPVTAPFVVIIEKIINLLDENGAFPQVLSAEAQAAIVAGHAAARASSATTGIEAYKRQHAPAITTDVLPSDPFATLKKE